MSARTKPLSTLLSGIARPGMHGDIVVHGLSIDSRDVRDGDAFIALRGGRAHGITFAPAALARGAAVVLAEAPAPARNEVAAGQSGSLAAPAGEGARRVEGGHGKRVEKSANQQPQTTHCSAGADARAEAPIIWIDNLRAQVGEIAARFFDHPSAAMHVIGVTGTNGKTSTVQLLAAALQRLGARAATIGTLGAGMAGSLVAGERTTPDVVSVHAMLAQFRDAGATHVSMEVSSHALDQGRVNAVGFELAVFTNLSRDHLDYHADMRAYAAAKARLFDWPGLHAAAINLDDAFGRELASGLRPDIDLLGYAINDTQAPVRALDVQCSDAGLVFRLATPWGEGMVRSSLLGRFNVYNLLAVAACLGELGYAFGRILGVLGELEPVAGRMSRLGGGSVPLVVVDYAHTPDALEQALRNLRSHGEGKLICVFGCGGERDRGKRAQMGAIAERLADRVIVTDDNPRGENGDKIVAQIIAGMAAPRRATIERDRARAIKQALREAGRGDVVLIAGKGHEPYQEIAGIRHPFDDVDIARQVLEARPC